MDFDIDDITEEMLSEGLCDNDFLIKLSRAVKNRCDHHRSWWVFHMEKGRVDIACKEHERTVLFGNLLTKIDDLYKLNNYRFSNK